jgi:hypothetical protein
MATVYGRQERALYFFSNIFPAVIALSHADLESDTAEEAESR